MATRKLLITSNLRFVQKNNTKIAGLPLTETYDYVFCIGAVFKVWIRS
jgi:hypothetical protein